MSIEYLGCPTPPLGQAMIGDMLEEFSRTEGFRTVRRTDAELGLVGLGNDETEAETITISLKGTEVYLGFHAATRSERDRVVAVAKRILDQLSIECDLEEQ